MRRLIALTALVAPFLASPAQGAPVLPYSERKTGYSGWSDTVRGDIPNVGMSGAMVGLAESFVGTLDNPAGLGMTLMRPGLQLTRNRVQDGIIQDYDNILESRVIGATFTNYPWGFALGTWVPNLEGQTYIHPVTGEKFDAELRVQEYHISAARSLFNNRLSLGGTLTLSDAQTTLDFSKDSDFDDDSDNRLGLSGGFGAMVRLPRRWILGIAYHFPTHLAGRALDGDEHGIENFHQTVHAPFRLAVGAGYIPNRFFKFGFGFYYTGPIEDAALLRDDTIVVGSKMNFQPRFGVAYQFLDYKNIEATFRGGTYLEVSRSLDLYSRLHLTTAVEVRPWVLTFGMGLDIASNYRNYMVSAGVNVIRLFERLDLLPTVWQPPRAGFLPRITRTSEEGLPRPLVDHWEQHRTRNLLIEGPQIPGRIKQKLLDAPDDIAEFGEDVLDSIGDTIGDGLEAVKDAVVDEPAAAKPASKSPKKPPKKKQKKPGTPKQKKVDPSSSKQKSIEAKPPQAPVKKK